MKRKTILIICSILFLIDLLLVLTNNTELIDQSVYEFFISFKNDTLTNIFIFLTNLSSSKFIIVLNIIILLYILIIKNTKILIVTICSIFSTVVNNLLKFIIRRPRPDGVALVVENTYSFPSGHAMISILFYGTIIYLIYHHKVKYRHIIASILIIYILLVGISRIYLGVHYVTDVVGGYLMSIMILIALTYFYEKKFKE